MSLFNVKINQEKMKKYESGQAIVLIALVMLALLAATGVAIDGGALLLQQREVQNALDHAVMSGTLALCAGGDAVSASTQAARTSGFENGRPRQSVTVQSPPDATFLPSGHSAINSSNHVLININVERESYFIHLVYQGGLGVNATGVGFCKPETTAFQDYSFAALAEDVNRAFDMTGNQTTNWCGGGAYSNSDSDTPGGAYTGSNPTINDMGTNLDDGSTCSDTKWSSVGPWEGDENIGIGTVSESTGDPTPNPFTNLSPPSCPSDKYYRSLLPDGTANPNVENGGVVPTGHQVDGIECWDSIQCGNNGSVTNISALNTDSASDVLVLSEGMTNMSCDLNITEIMVYTPGSFTQQGGAANMSAPTAGDWSGFLLWSEGSSIRLNGNGSTSLTGTIYAPNAAAVINGDSGSTFRAQLIAYTIDFSGGSGTNIIYDENKFFKIPPQIEIVD